MEEQIDVFYVMRFHKGHRHAVAKFFTQEDAVASATVDGDECVRRTEPMRLQHPAHRPGG